MDQTRITQCPKCDTTFRITPAQLKVANGAVRCGACLNVFRAAEHFQATVEEEPVLQDDRTQDLFSDDHRLIDSTDNQSQELINDDPAEDDDNGLIDDSGYVNEKNSAPSEPPAPEPKETKLGFGDIIDDTGYIGDDFLIDDDNGLIDDEKAPPKEVEFNEDFLSLNTEDKSGTFFSNKNDLEATVNESESEDESWAHALLDDSEDFEPANESKPAPEAKPEAPIAKPKAVKKDIFPNQTIGASFDQFEAAPLELNLPERKKRHKAILMGLACLIMVGTLIAQAAYFNFDQWARQDNYRPWYKMACQSLACTLPSSYDLGRIRTTASPQVSSHPKYKNALMIDVLFMNSAEFTQPFPKLELTFSNAGGKVVAHRLFSPREYLAGEASGLTMMPTHTPIHIALEIADPGKDANNYQVRFLAP